MKYNKDSGNLAFVLGVVTSVVTILSLAVALFAILDRKKKEKEDRELQEYLDTSIN